MIEVKEIPDWFWDKYTVDKCGNVYSFAHNTPHILKPITTRQGYLVIDVYNAETGKNERFKVHRLVAAKYIDNPDGFRYVNHIDGDKTNNRVSNLEWCSPSDNCKHAHKLVLHSTIKANKARMNRVVCIELHTIYQSIEEAAKILDICSSSIGKVCRHKQETAGGYHWRYLDEE